jgi:hypothetical protein
MKTSKITAVYAVDVRQLMDYESERGFDKVSYGDAEFTLVKTSELLKELSDEDKEEYPLLVKDLKSIRKGVLVALYG